MPGEVAPGPGQRPVLTVVPAHHGVKVRSHSVVEIIAHVGLRGPRGGGWNVVRIVTRRRLGVVVRSRQPDQVWCVILNNLVHHTPGWPAVDGDKVRSRIELDWHQVRRGSLLKLILITEMFSRFSSYRV